VNLLTLKDWSPKDIREVIDNSLRLKKKKKFLNLMKNKNLLMIFSKPSLRTHLSFDIAMKRLGGQAIFYNLSNSTLGEKESIKDFSKVVSRYADVVMARLYEHKQIEELAKWSSVPIINGLTDYFHPCQAIGDFLTIKEKLKKIEGKKIAFLGDTRNNVAHSLIIGAEKLGAEITISSPDKKAYLPDKKAIGNLKYRFEKNPEKAVKDVDIIYTDTWMSYQISKSKERQRLTDLKKYQINERIFNINKKALFMHCLPAKRGVEVTDSIIDSDRSIVYDQAENRMWSEKGILLKCMKK